MLTVDKPELSKPQVNSLQASMPIVTVRRPALTIPALLLVLLVAWVLRLFRLAVPPAWHDETYTALVALRPLGDIVALSAADIHPPLHFLLLHFWIPLAGSSEFALRYVSAAWSLLAVALLYALGRLIYTRRAGLIAAVFLAISPFAVAYAQEIRMYAMLLALVIAATYMLVSWVRKPRTRSLAFYTLLAIAGLYTNYYAATVLAAHGLWVLLRTIRGIAAQHEQCDSRPDQAEIYPFKLLLSYAAAGVVVVLCYIPQLAIALHQIADYTVSLLRPITAETFFHELWQAYTLGPDIDALWLPQLDPLLIVLASLSLVLALAGLLGNRRSFRAFLPLLWLGVPVLAMFVLTLQRPFFHPRFLLLALPAYLLLAGSGIDVLGRVTNLTFAARKLRAGLLPAMLALLCTLLIVGSAVPGLQSYYFNSRFARDDTRSLAAWLQTHTTERDAVIVDVEFLLDYYFHGPAPQRYMLADEQTSAVQLTRFAGHAERVFLVNWYQADADPKGYIPYLLDRYGRRTGSQTFQGYTVTIWQLPGTVDFAPAGDWQNVQASFGDALALVAQSYGGASGGAAPTTAPACTGEQQASTRTQCPAPSVPSGERVWVDLKWKLLRPVSVDYASVVYLRDKAGHAVGQSDRPIFSNTRLAASKLAPGDQVDAYYMLPVEPGTLPGEYTLEAAVYDPANLRKLEAVRAGARSEVVPLGQVQVTPQFTPPDIASLGIQQRVDKDLTVSIRLLGYNLVQTNAKPGDSLDLTLFWQALHDVNEKYTFSLRLVDKNGKLLSSQEIAPVYATTNWRAGDVLRDREQVQVGAGIPGGEVDLVLALVDPDSKRIASETKLDTLTVQERAHNFTLPMLQHTQEAYFGNLGQQPWLELLGYDLSPANAIPGQALTLKLYWKCLASPPQNYTVFTQLVDGQNQIWAQQDKPPAIPVAGWVPGEIVSDEFTLTIKADTPVGNAYTLLTGFYDPASGQRIMLVDAAGKLLETRVVLDTQVQVAR